MVYWSLLEYLGWRLYLAATVAGLCYVDNGSFDELSAWVGRRLPGRQLVQSDGPLRPYVLELEAYLRGELRSFTGPFDLHGTPFQIAVWRALLEIPYGETVAYADIAAHIGRPTAVRAVGGAIGSNPVGIVVPCHRVIGKDGSLTGYGGGLPMKKRLLALERGLVAVQS